MNLPPDLVAMLTAFADERVRYLIVGGHAVGVHARPRTTKDLDVWLDADRENVVRACAALGSFGVPRSIVEALAAAAPEEIVWLGRAPARVDLLFTLAGVDFSKAWSRRVEVDVAGLRVPVIGREDLIANKRRVGRPRDKADVRALERAGKRRG